MLFYSNFVCYNQVFAPKSGLLSQKMPNAALIKSAVVFASIRYWPKAFSVVMYSYNLDAYWARRSSNTQMQILYDIKDLDENSTSESSIGSTR